LAAKLKIEKSGEEILIVHCCFSISQNEQLKFLPGWLLLLKIEISSIVHCCFSISQNELKFELQLHGKE
jgi:hypothetical protein